MFVTVECTTRICDGFNRRTQKQQTLLKALSSEKEDGGWVIKGEEVGEGKAEGWAAATEGGGDPSSGEEGKWSPGKGLESLG